VGRTADETCLLFTQLLPADRGPTACIVSCVVPNALYAITKGVRRAFSIDCMVVGRGLKTGLKLRTDNPREVGSDRIVNAVAAMDTYGSPVVVVNFATALTVDCVNARGEYIGGAIAPGFKTAEDALFHATAQLPRVAIAKPASPIGATTVTAVQSGLYWGFTGLVDRLVEQCTAALDGPVTVVGTGGLVALLGDDCRTLDHLDRDLGLRGLARLYKRNA
jgi:type III pantothenate kinase